MTKFTNFIEDDNNYDIPSIKDIFASLPADGLIKEIVKDDLDNGRDIILLSSLPFCSDIYTIEISNANGFLQIQLWIGIVRHDIYMLNGCSKKYTLKIINDIIAKCKKTNPDTFFGEDYISNSNHTPSAKIHWIKYNGIVLTTLAEIEEMILVEPSHWGC